MRKRQNAIPAERIRDEIRKLNQIGKSEVYRSFDEEAAVDLILRLGVPGAETEVQVSTEVRISPVIKYRLLVGGVGIAYEGGSESEAVRQFNLFMAKSKNPKKVKIGSDINAGCMEIDPFEDVSANFCFALAAGWVFLCHTYLGYLVAGLFSFKRSASARVGEIVEIF